MNPLAFITGIFKPLTELIDNLHTSDEEKAQAKLLYAQQQYVLVKHLMDYEAKLLTAQQDIITTETQADSWLTRSWRPITMLTFLTLVVCDQFGWLTFRLNDEAWVLLQLGLGGYVVGRSAEKVVPAVLEAMQKKS